MKSLKIFFLILISVLHLSCGEGGRDITSLEFSLFAEAEEQRVTLFGVSDRGEFFSKNLNGEENVKLDLPNGDWRFYVLVWTPEESIKCGVSSKKYLNGLSLNVDLVVNNLNCLDREFMAMNSIDMGGESFFPELQIEDSDSSYKIKLYSMDNFQGTLLRKGTTSYETDCLNSENGPYKLNLPFKYSELPFHYVLEKYDGTSCAEFIDEENLPHNSSMIEYDEENVLFKLMNHP